MLKSQSSRQIWLKRGFYLRWQRWSRSLGLIYLRVGIMNSLWHLISQSPLIWLSAGIRTAIHGPLDRSLTHLDALPMADLEPVTLKDANFAGVLLSPPSLLQLLKNTEKLTYMSSVTHGLSTAHSYGYFTRPFIITPILLSLYCFSLFWYWWMRIPTAYSHVRTSGVP